MGFLDDVQNLSIEEKFKKYLPNTLYMSHYLLAESYGNTPEEWRKFLRDNHLFIESELAAITEAEARSALSRLGNAGGQEVTALKALLDKSKLINDAQRQNVKVVMHFLPSNEEELSNGNTSASNRNTSDNVHDNRHNQSMDQNKKEEEVKNVTEPNTRLSSDRPYYPGPESPSHPILKREEPKRERVSKYR
jgi:hypothetical protein